MPHVVFFIYQLSLSCGTAGIGMCAAVYMRYRKPSLKYFIFFMTALLGFLLSFLVNQYRFVIAIPGSDGPFAAATVIFRICGTLLLVFSAPFFYHSLIGRELAARGQVLVGLLLLVTVILFIIDIGAPGLLFSLVASLVLIIGLILYGLLYIAVQYSQIGDRSLRRAILVFLVVSAVFLPLLVIDILLVYLPALAFLEFMNNLVQPVYLLVISVLFMVFALKHFSEPPYRVQGRWTEHFRAKFGLSERECEIVERLVAGDGAKQIAAALCISTRTVENHSYNIFKKCDVKNRLQLHQIVMSNTAE